MVDLDAFMEKNNLQKQELASYLGVSNAFISQVCKGKAKLSPERLAQLKENGSWDTSMLFDGPSATANASGNGVAHIQMGNNSTFGASGTEIELLRSIIKEKDNIIRDKDNIIAQQHRTIEALTAAISKAN